MNLAAELAPRVRVNCVSPGGTRTPMVNAYVTAYRAGAADRARADRELATDAVRLILGGLAEPDDVASTVAHVALDARAMTGQVVYTDSGFTAR